jgi:hypothetical protein
VSTGDAEHIKSLHLLGLKLVFKRSFSCYLVGTRKLEVIFKPVAETLRGEVQDQILQGEDDFIVRWDIRGILDPKYKVILSNKMVR